MSTSLTLRLDATYQCCPKRLITTGLLVESYIRVNRHNVTMSALMNLPKTAKEVAGNHEASLHTTRELSTRTHTT
jgi:hypothetical protein